MACWIICLPFAWRDGRGEAKAKKDDRPLGRCRGDENHGKSYEHVMESIDDRKYFEPVHAALWHEFVVCMQQSDKQFSLYRDIDCIHINDIS